MQPTQSKANGQAAKSSLFRLEDLEVSTRNRYVEVEIRERELEMLSLEAESFAASSIVPNTFQKNAPNCAIALNMAKRRNLEPLMVMQNLYIVNNRPSWSSKFLVAMFNMDGKFGSIQYEASGTPGADTYGYVAFAESRDGKRVEGPKVTWAMVKGEGWLDRNGSKWKTMPEVMFRYRSASFMINTVCPEIAMGFTTVEEAEDMGATPDTGPNMTGVKEGSSEEQKRVRDETIAKLQNEARERRAKEDAERAATAKATAQQQKPVTETQSAPVDAPAEKLDLRKEVAAWVQTIPNGIQTLGNNGYESVDQIPEAKLADVLAELKAAVPGSQPKATATGKPVFGKKA